MLLRWSAPRCLFRLLVQVLVLTHPTNTRILRHRRNKQARRQRRRGRSGARIICVYGRGEHPPCCYFIFSPFLPSSFFHFTPFTPLSFLTCNVKPLTHSPQQCAQAPLPAPHSAADPGVDAHPAPSHQPPLWTPSANAGIDSHHADLHHFNADPDAYHADADADTFHFDANAPSPSTSASHTQEHLKRWEVEVRAKWDAEE